MSSRDPETCVVCGGSMRRLFVARVLGRHDVAYFQCAACEYVTTETPHWLEEAYGEAISRADTGLVMRNLLVARRLTCVLYSFFDWRGRFLDTAGGTGLLTRMMRDIGFDFYWEDPYCKNVLAPGFEADAAGRDFEAVTAFEAVEHMTDPVGFIERNLALSRTGTFVFSTELFSSGRPDADWWYFAFPTGQHISFFSHRTLEAVARRVGRRLLSHGWFHALTGADISGRAFAKIVEKSDGPLYEKIVHKLPSRTEDDHRAMLKRLESGG